MDDPKEKTMIEQITKLRLAGIAALTAIVLALAGCGSASGSGLELEAGPPVAWHSFVINGLEVYATVNSIAYAEGVGFIAGTGTDWGNPVLARSADGGPGDWAVKELTGLEHYDSYVGKIRRLNDRLLITRGSGVKYGLVSNDAWDDSQGWDGWTWTEAAIGFGTKAHAYGGGVYLAGGQHGQAAWSDDGMTSWHPLAREQTTFAVGEGNQLYINGAAYGNGRFVIGGGKGHTAVSDDGGKTWTGSAAGGTTSPQAIFDSGFIDTMLFFKGKFIALGGMDGSYTKAAYSDDGLLWYQGNMPPESANSLINSSDGPRMAASPDYVVAVANNGKAAYSANGIDWTELAVGFETYTPIKDIAYGNGRFVAVGNEGKAAYSDGEK
jgi:hypothetical protein